MSDEIEARDASAIELGWLRESAHDLDDRWPIDFMTEELKDLLNELQSGLTGVILHERRRDAPSPASVQDELGNSIGATEIGVVDGELRLAESDHLGV